MISGQVQFVVINFLAAYISFSVSELTLGEREYQQRLIASMAGFPVLVSLTVFILGTLGRLNVGWVVFLLSPPALILAYFQQEKRKSVNTVFDAGKTRVWKRQISLVVLALFLGILTVKTFLSGSNYLFDVLNYHATAPAHWLQDQRLSLAPYNYHAYFALNSELLSLWFMLPFHSDALVGLCGLFWVTLSIASIMVLCLSSGVSFSVSVLAGALFSASTMVVRWSGTFSAANLAGPAMILASSVFFIPQGNTTGKKRRVMVFYGGLTLGFAVGAKASFIPLPIVFFLWILFRKNEEDNQRRGREGAIFLLGVVLTGSYWYVRNAWLTGNPLFPAQIGPFDGPFGTLQQNHTKLITWIVADLFNLNHWKLLFLKHLDWPHHLGVLSLLGYGGNIYRWLRKKASPLEKDRNSITLFLLIIGLTMLAVYPFTPFTGTANTPENDFRWCRRFIIGPFAIGLVLFSSMTNKGFPGKRFWQLLLAGSVLISLYSCLPDFLVRRSLITAGILLGLANFLLLAVMPNRIKGLTLLILVALAIWAPYAKHLNDVQLYGDKKKYSSPLGSGWRFLETLPQGSRIAGFGPVKWLYYPLFGRRIQLIPTVIHQPMHEFWRKEGTRWDTWTGDGVSKSIRKNRFLFSGPFLSKLIDLGVNYVMVSKWKGTWVDERKLLVEAPGARKIYGDFSTEVWEIQIHS